MTPHPPLRWSDLPGRTVGLWGLGVEGRASLRRLETLGVTPAVVVEDDPSTPVPGPVAVMPTAGGGLEALARCQVVIKSPGISRHRPEVTGLEEAGAAVVGGLGLWLEEAVRDRVVCVTGTKGKSTTVAVAGHLLERLGYRCLVAGNIGQPPYDPEVAGDYDYWVVEVSSFQATDLTCSPPVVAVTSLHPDHLDWHGDAETYYREKLLACSRPGARVTVADGTNDLLRRRRDLLGPQVRWVVPGDPALDDGPGGGWWTSLGLVGGAAHRNALAARACLEELGVPEARDAGALARAARDFPALESRLQPVGEVGGVLFVDDGLATNVLPTLAALEAFAHRRVALIVGGFDRGIDYAPLAQGLAARSESCLVVTVPDNGPRIHAAVDAGPRPAPPVVDCPDLEEATRVAYRWARPDGVVLLSPAAPSFGRFRDYRDRAAAFAGAVRSLGPPAGEDEHGEVGGPPG